MPLLAALMTASDALLVGLAAYFVFQLLAFAAYLFSMTGGRIWTWECIIIAYKPLALCVLTCLAAAFQGWRRYPAGFLWLATTLVVCGLALTFQLVGPFGAVHVRESFAPMRPFLIAPFALLALLRGPLRRWWRMPTAMALAFLCGTLAAACRPHSSHPIVNRLGLVCAPPNRVDVQDFSHHTNKDNYPVCRFEYNSLGYRDREPSFSTRDGRRRILLVGNSFIWGDGIPSNEETLGYLLRDELDRRAPGRFVVMSAAYPALGLYGYGRILKTVAPVYNPDIVLAQYAPFEGHMLSDPQFLFDRLPANRFMRNAVLSINGIWCMNEAIVVVGYSIFAGRRAIGNSIMDPAALLADIARQSVQDRYRVVFFMYDYEEGHEMQPVTFPGPIARLDLPRPWQYSGAASDLWYAKDYHPKPKLNRLVAAYLAESILSHPQWRASADPPSPAPDKAPRP
jgi:hypothetical protein